MKNIKNQMNIEKVSLDDKFCKFNDHWNPRIAASLNNHYVKFAKLLGEFVWHSHENDDEMFFVVKGCLRMDFRDKSIFINENEFLIVPKGTEHCPYAESEVWIMLIEPQSTVNTGNVVSKLTKNILERI